ncbi:hypothetical protein ACA910_009895 [Epithemia clementina (nom. ined.)]
MSINTVAMSLMPISQTAAWYALITSDNATNPTGALYMTLGWTSSFYCGWALYKVLVEGDKKELGQYSMGLTALATFCQSKYASIGALGLVLVNFCYPIYLVMGMSASELAKLVKKTDSKKAIVWAWTFKGYLVSNLIFWGFALSKVSQS